jgi:arginase family enzyme
VRDDASVVPVDIHVTFERITNDVKTILDAGATVITLGGDHSIALPLLRAHNAKFGKVAMMHFDSHGDMWDYDFEGFKAEITSRLAANLAFEFISLLALKKQNAK